MTPSKEPADAVIVRYWEGLFEFELAKCTLDTELWPENRDFETFRRWFDVELRDLVVDLGTEPLDPPVWRRIQVPAGYSFWDLHVAVADVMGWLDYHLHLFSVRNPETGEHDPIGIFDEDNPDGPHCLPDAIVPIASYFLEPGDRAWYTYDYGDTWVHELVLEEVLPREKGKRYPKCLDGARACPPEEVGGPHGYAMMLESLDDASHPEHESFLEWLGGCFDPDRFDPKKVTFDSPKKRFEIAFGGGEPF